MSLQHFVFSILVKFCHVATCGCMLKVKPCKFLVCICVYFIFLPSTLRLHYLFWESFSKVHNIFTFNLAWECDLDIFFHNNIVIEILLLQHSLPFLKEIIVA